MPAYKYTLKSGKTLWYANFYCQNWNGKRSHICKRGFATKKEAVEFERSYISQSNGNTDMLFEDMVKLYLADAKARLKVSSFDAVNYALNALVVPVFGKTKTSEIDAKDIRKWQSDLIAAGYSSSYINSNLTRLSTVMNFAVNYYGLTKNPCSAVGRIKKKRSQTLDIWTREEFVSFHSLVPDLQSQVIFDVLFYSGIRIGECMALTPADLLPNKKLRITKDGFRKGGKFIVQDTPKTAKSCRDVDIPDFLYDELNCYISKLYGIKKNDQIFTINTDTLRNRMMKLCDEAGIKKIRIHDIRHSHVSMLISMGYDAKLISERLGHESIQITMDTYGHLYKDSGKAIADGLQALNEQN